MQFPIFPPAKWQLELAGGCSIFASAISSSHAHSGASETGLRLVLLLQGELNLGFGCKNYALTQHASRGADVLLLNLTEQEEFQRRAVATELEKKICLHIPAGWLQEYGLHESQEDVSLQRFTQQHLADAQWHADPQLTGLAERLLAPISSSPLIERLRRESLAFELLASVLTRLQQTSPNVPAHICRRLLEIRDLLDHGTADEWSLAEIAAQACMSPTTLQRHFRRQFGSSVFDYLRQKKLERARDKLCRGQESITTAALEAGYNSPANFATAFRRAFGISPSECK